MEEGGGMISIVKSLPSQVKESLNIEQDSFGSNDVFPEAQAGERNIFNLCHKVIDVSLACPPFLKFASYLIFALLF